MRNSFLLFCFLVIVSGCAFLEDAQKFGQEAIPVQAAVVERTGHKDVLVRKFNGSELQIVLINSKYNEMELEAKKKAAKNIAELAWEKLPTKTGFEQVRVIFYIQTKKYGVEYKNSTDSHQYKIDELGSVETKSPTPALKEE